MKTSPATVTKSPTFPLTDEQRERVIDVMVQRYLDGMSGRDLERFFCDIQTDYLKEYSDEELWSEITDIFFEDEFSEILNETD
jgi:hypothetical protein